MSHRLRTSKQIAASLLALANLLPIAALGQAAHSGPHKNSAAAPQTSAVAGPRSAAGYARLPLAFEPNVGQTDSRVRFLSHTAGGSLFLTDTEAILTLPCATGKKESDPSRLDPKQRKRTEKATASRLAVIRMKLVGAQKPASALVLAPLPGVVNYLRGNNPKLWHTHVPTYGEARFTGVYKGVDMVYYGTQGGKLEYDFVVKPGADPKAIRLAFSGATGASVTPKGELRLHTAAGEVRWQRPITYQIANGHRKAVACAYELKREGGKASVGFRLARYDASCPVVIDPVLSYSTFLGGSGGDNGNAIAVDNKGNAYITGHTSSIDFPVTSGSFQPRFQELPNNVSTAPGNAFVTKINTNSSGQASLVYSTYLGGTNSYGDFGNAVAVDGAGNAYITGITYCTNFPVWPAATSSTHAFQTTNHDITDGNAFVTKLSPTGASLIYSTYLGGSLGDCGYGIAVDAATGGSNAYITGYTFSYDFPVTPGAFQTTNNGFNYTNLISIASNAFVTKLNPAGTAEVYSTFLGGSGGTTPGGATFGDAGFAIALDSNSNAYVTGTTYSSLLASTTSLPVHSFPVTSNAFQPKNAGAPTGGNNAFVTELNTGLSGAAALVYSTYLGGSTSDYGYGIALDGLGSVYVTGFTQSTNFPVQGAFQPTLKSAAGNAFVTKFTPGTSAPTYSTYLGGSGLSGDSGNGIAVDSLGNAYITGYTSSTDFPVTGGTWQPTNHDPATTSTLNGSNAFLTELNAAGSSQVYSTFLGGIGDPIIGGDYGTGIGLDSIGNVYVTGSATSPGSVITTTATSSPDFPVTQNAYQTTNNGYDYDSGYLPNRGIGVATNAFVTVFALPSLTKTALTLSKTSVLGGVKVTGTITFSVAAPANGETVYLSSANPAVASVPATVAVAANKKTATFSITTASVSASTPVVLSASLLGENTSTTLTINPPTVSSLTLYPTSVTGGGTSTGTVTLTANAPIGGTSVTLSSDTPAVATVPASVTVAAGSNTATFKVNSLPVATVSTASISALLGGVTQSTKLTVNPAALGSLTLNPTSVKGGTTSTGTVTLTSNAPTGGTTVMLSSDTPSVALLPASVTVPAGKTTATFPVATLTVTATNQAVISATLGTVTKTASLTITQSPLNFLVNGSFELPALTNFAYTPQGNGWTYAGFSGLAPNGSDLGNANAPDGVQVGFVQAGPGVPSPGMISQSVNFSAGTYHITFAIAARPGGSTPVQFSVDGVNIGTPFTPASSTSFARVTTAGFTVTAGQHTIAFAATNNTQQGMTFIDQVVLGH